jgi:alkylation response protein AidB-like acyl-CoA dehydrogenase
MPVTHLQVAEAATKVDTAQMLLHAMVDRVERDAAARRVPPLVERARARMDCAYAVRLCLEAVETLVYASGGSGIAESNEVQLAARDVRALNMHGLLNWQTNLEMYGRLLVGLPANSPVI